MENTNTNANNNLNTNNNNNNNNLNTTNNNNIIKPKKKIKKEYYEMKPNLIRAHNLRFIEPYQFKYQLYTKGRWIGKKIIDVLLNEFRQYDRTYFIKALKDGNLMINEKTVEPEYILQRNDFMTHVTIRKENPIIDQKLEIVHEDEDYLVVDKPSSWPVHVCGGYQFNTLHRILMDEFSYKELRVLHRLDKHTSGIVIMAKNKKSAENFTYKLHTDEAKKTYLCRVKGNFNHEGSVDVERSIVYVNKAKGVYTDMDDEKVKEYYATDTDKKVKAKYDKAGCKIKNKKKHNANDSDDDSKDDEINEPKYAKTSFEKLFYNPESNTSVVIARPLTGRTHQIRIHLRYLGYPIANDPCYGGVVYNDLKEFQNPDMIKFQQFIPEIDEKSNDNMNNTTEELSVSQIYCYKIWLHAYRYKFDSYEFVTKMPEWADKEYKIDYKF
jgi:23S rRNA-/tRNA-specific pseudouridylate synthase